jgi:hypothetical protein
MEAEERQRRRRKDKQRERETNAELEASVPAAPQLADFLDPLAAAVRTAGLDQDASVDTTGQCVGREQELDSDNRQYMLSERSCSEEKLPSAPETLDVADSQAVVAWDGQEEAGEDADFAELGRGLHRLEPHFFLSKVSATPSPHDSQEPYYCFHFLYFLFSGVG